MVPGSNPGGGSTVARVETLCKLHILMVALAASILPGLEARIGAPLALTSCGVVGVIASYVVSTVAGILVYTLLSRIEGMISGLMPRVYRVYERLRDRLSRKAAGIAGFLGLIGFIAVPLPGSGVWSGAIIARVIGLDKRKAFVAIAMGNLIAVTIVTLVFKLASTLF